MSIPIGGSCVGWGSTTPDTTVNEIRFVRDNRHDPIAWNTVDMSIVHNIKMLLTVDSYLATGRGWGSDEALKNFTQECIDKYKSKTNRKSLWILDNEADEIYPLSVYVHYLDVFQRVVRRNGFEVGAGNFQFRKDYIYGLVFRKDLYDVMCVHMQNGFETASKIETNGNWYKQLKDTYGLRMTCTEAIPTTWNLGDHYPLVIKQLIKAIDIGCEDFCVIFIHGENPAMLKKYKQLTFTQYPDKWTDFKRIIKDNKPIEIPERIIDGMIIKTIGNNDTDIKSGYSIELLNQLLIHQGFLEEAEVTKMFTFTQLTYEAVKEWQTALGITVDGRVGRQGWRNFINDVQDATERKKFQFDFEVVMSPYNIDGDT